MTIFHLFFGKTILSIYSTATDNCLYKGAIFTLVCATYLVFLIFSAQSSAAQVSRWVFVSESPDGIRVYLDKTSIEKTRGFVRLWDKRVFPDRSSLVSQTVWDCNERRFSILTTFTYTAEGKQVKQLEDGSWLDIAPESIAEAFYDVVCRSGSTQTNVPEFKPKNIQVISKLANIRELPSMNAGVVKKAARGMVFQLVNSESENGWYQIYINNNKTAWIHGNTVEFIYIVPPPSQNNRNKKNLLPSLLNDSEFNLN